MFISFFTQRDIIFS